MCRASSSALGHSICVLNKWCIFSLLLCLSFFSLQLYFYCPCVLHENKGFLWSIWDAKSKVGFWQFRICAQEVELLDHIATLFLTFWGTAIPFSIMAALIYISQNSVQEDFLSGDPSFVSKVYNLSSFSEDLFSQVTVSSGPDTHLPRTEKLGVRGTKILQKSSMIWDWGAPLSLFGVLADPKHPEIHYTPQKKSLSLAPCSSLPFLPHSLPHQWTTVFGTASWEAGISVTPAWQWLPLHTQDDWTPINTTPSCAPTLNLFYLAFEGASTACLLISPNLSIVKDPAQF